MQPIVIFAIGSAIVVELIQSCRRLGRPIAGYVRNMAGEDFLPAGLVATDANALDEGLTAHDCLCPLFQPANRRGAVRQALELGFSFGTSIVDPTAIVADDIRVGGGSFVNAGVVIGADTALGDHVLINRSASLGHHNRLGAFTSVGPGAILAGQVTTGGGVMIGAGAIIGPRVTIGADAVIGAGSLVLQDVPDGHKVLGRHTRRIAGEVPGGTVDGAG